MSKAKVLIPLNQGLFLNPKELRLHCVPFMS